MPDGQGVSDPGLFTPLFFRENIAKRKHLDIAAVNTAMSFRIEEDQLQGCAPDQRGRRLPPRRSCLQRLPPLSWRTSPSAEGLERQGTLA